MEKNCSMRKLALTLRSSFLFATLVLVSCSAAMPTELAEVAILEEMHGIPEEFVSCISVNGKDADPDLLGRLARTGRSFVPASECIYVMDVTKGSYHQSTRRKAILIDVAGSGRRNQVTYASQHDGKWGVTVTFKVQQDNGKWRIVEALNRIEA